MAEHEKALKQLLENYHQTSYNNIVLYAENFSLKAEITRLKEEVAELQKYSRIINDIRALKSVTDGKNN